MPAVCGKPLLHQTLSSSNHSLNFHPARPSLRPSSSPSSAMQRRPRRSPHSAQWPGAVGESVGSGRTVDTGHWAPGRRRWQAGLVRCSRGRSHSHGSLDASPRCSSPSLAAHCSLLAAHRVPLPRPSPSSPVLAAPACTPTTRHAVRAPLPPPSPPRPPTLPLARVVIVHCSPHSGPCVPSHATTPGTCRPLL